MGQNRVASKDGKGQEINIMVFLLLLAVHVPALHLEGSRQLGNSTFQSNDYNDTAKSNQSETSNATDFVNNGTSDKLNLKDDFYNPVSNERGNTTNVHRQHRYSRQVHDAHANPTDCSTNLKTKPAKCADVITLPQLKTSGVSKPMHLEQSNRRSGYEGGNRQGFGLNPRDDYSENNGSFEHRTSAKRPYKSEEDGDSKDDTARRWYRERMNPNGDGYRRDNPRNTYNDRDMERDLRQYGSRGPANTNRNTRDCEEFYKQCNGEHKPNVNFGDNFGSNPSGYGGFYDEYSNGMERRRRPNQHGDYPGSSCPFPGFDGSCMQSFGSRGYGEGFHASRYDRGSSEDSDDDEVESPFGEM